MSAENNISVPDAEESSIYFDSLPTNSHAPRRITPRALSMSDSRKGIDNDNQAEVSKDNPAIIAFADGVSLANREAVMLAVEFAEVVATNKGDINQDPIKWLTDYAEALRYGGWLTIGGHEYGHYKTSNQSLTMDSVVLELIGAVAGPNAATVIQLLSTVLDKLQKDRPLMQLFERNSKRGTNATFRIMPCLESQQGIPVTYLLALHCDFSKESGGALFWKWSVSRLEIKRLAKGVNFNRSTHDRNKQRILDYLEGDADDFFAGLK